MDEMFRVRARVFRDRLRWDVQVADGRERDKYDDEGPVYVIYADDEARQVKGTLRLLPTTGPTLLADIFSDTLPIGVHLSAPTIWECSRFCVNDQVLRGDREAMLFASSILIAALGDLAIRAGIESILGNFDSTMLRIYRRIGCKVEVLGSTQRYGRPVYLGLFPISEAILCEGQRRLKDAQWKARSAARCVGDMPTGPPTIGSSELYSLQVCQGLCDQPHQLIDARREDAEHQVAEHVAVAPWSCAPRTHS
jgi:acyl homoserine lactone synthase